MNNAKRKILESVVNIIQVVRDEEADDLEATPDNIEDSSDSDSFRSVMMDLDIAVSRIFAAIKTVG